MKFPVMMLVGLAAAVMVGCKDESAADAERLERAGALFEEALTAEANGELSKAELLYTQVLRGDATNASAHLNLAMLLHEQKKDYVGAIHHYQSYLDLQPEAEKVPMVKGQVEVVRTLLADQLATEQVNRRRRELEEEYSAIRTEVAELQTQVAALRKDNLAKDEELSELKRKVKDQAALIAQLREAEEAYKKASAEELATAKREAEESKKDEADLPEEPTDDLIKSIREDALRMIEEEDGGQAERNEATREAVEGVQDEAPISASPLKGHQYLVRPGDTLMALAREAYGSEAAWGTIQQANRNKINPDGRLNAGEVIYLP